MTDCQNKETDELTPEQAKLVVRAIEAVEKDEADGQGQDDGETTDG